jgi:hypothetical protein
MCGLLGRGLFDSDADLSQFRDPFLGTKNPRQVLLLRNRNSLLLPIFRNLRTHSELSQTEEKVYLNILTCSKTRKNGFSNAHVLFGNETLRNGNLNNVKSVSIEHEIYIRNQNWNKRISNNCSGALKLLSFFYRFYTSFLMNKSFLSVLLSIWVILSASK